MNRQAAVAGLFYPDDKKTLIRQVDAYLKQGSSPLQSNLVRALIVPHAGFVYSGSVAADAYRQISDYKYDNIFLIGTSHKASFKGAVIPSASSFETPLGNVPINTEITNKLISLGSAFRLGDEHHRGEHTLEVQLPFLQRSLKELKIVPILIGSGNIEELEKMARTLKPYFNSSNLFVVSSDFSHYPKADDAEKIDRVTTEVICKNEPQALVQHLHKDSIEKVPNLLTQLCGWSSILTLLYLTSDAGLVYRQLSYQHSGMKLTQDRSRVVGYQAIVVSEKGRKDNLSDKESIRLINIAKEAIHQHLGRNAEVSEPDQIQLQTSGVFVSVYCGKELRGCIGQFESQLNLNALVKKLAVDAAFFDTRFKAIEINELQQLGIEISLLTPLKKVRDVSEIKVGYHGVYIKKGLNHGTFLPQVGARNNWSVTDYLGYCSRDKAKIGWEGWKDAEIYTFEARIIKNRIDS
jgi:AmmeMemoRadiSam system protein B/AmmeMemoRadiSam system protein A